MGYTFGREFLQPEQGPSTVVRERRPLVEWGPSRSQGVLGGCGAMALSLNCKYLERQD